MHRQGQRERERGVVVSLRQESRVWSRPGRRDLVKRQGQAGDANLGTSSVIIQERGGRHHGRVVIGSDEHTISVVPVLPERYELSLRSSQSASLSGRHGYSRWWVQELGTSVRAFETGFANHGVGALQPCNRHARVCTSFVAGCDEPPVFFPLRLTATLDGCGRERILEASL